MQSLSPSQAEILCLVAQGMSLREIAKLKHISYSTCKNQADEAKSRLRAQNLAEAVAQAFVRGVLVYNLREEQVVIWSVDGTW